MRPIRYFVIYSQSETENSNGEAFWSNCLGWGNLSDATVFTYKETNGFDLPVAHHGDAIWRELPACLMIRPDWEDE